MPEKNNQPATAPATEEKPDDESKDNPGAITQDASQAITTEDEIRGYAPLRHWINYQLRNKPTSATLPHGGENREVQELLIDGRLRLKVDDTFVLVPLDARYIPELFAQLL